MGRTVEALADFGKAIELAPGWPLPLANRASLHTQTDALNRAVTDYTTAIRIVEQAAEENPDAAERARRLPAVHLLRDARMGPPGAWASSARPKTTTTGPSSSIPTIRVFLARGQFAFETGQPEAALADFSEVIRLRPDLVDGYLQRRRSGSHWTTAKRPSTT